jgi:putative polyhydroxyalkanoate system protein
MNLIVVHRTHTLGRDEARRRIAEAVTRYAGRYAVRTVWDGDELLASRAGAKARIRVSDDAVVVELELGILLGHWRERARGAVEQFLTELLG